MHYDQQVRGANSLVGFLEEEKHSKSQKLPFNYPNNQQKREKLG